MLGNRRWLSVLVVAALATAGLGLSAAADPTTEGGFFNAINATRATHGLGSLSVDDGLRGHARKHTQDMMDADGIYHSSSEELGAAGGDGWSKIGENVGRGNTVDSLHNAFMNSEGHKKNILGDYNYIGIGTGSKDGRLYVTVIFMKKGTTPTSTTTTQPAPTTTAAAPTTTKAPASTTTSTTTTIPPTTTTTMDVPPDKPVTPGVACVAATRFGQLCHN